MIAPDQPSAEYVPPIYMSEALGPKYKFSIGITSSESLDRPLMSRDQPRPSLFILGLNANHTPEHIKHMTDKALVDAQFRNV